MLMQRLACNRLPIRKYQVDMPFCKKKEWLPMVRLFHLGACALRMGMRECFEVKII